MKRRTFIRNSSLTTLGVSAFGLLDLYGKGFGSNNNFNVNGHRIKNRIIELSKFGIDTKGHGYRVAYTKGDIEGRAWFMELMKKGWT